MDSKFRKLISRLSIKEKTKHGIPRPLSISPLPDDPVFSDDENECGPDRKNKESPDSERGETNGPKNRKNILTNVQFPCPTLLRKWQSMNENLYEEVKPARKLRAPSPESGDEKGGGDGGGANKPTDNGGTLRDENNNEVGGLYVNLQELEIERRRLISAQAVRAKYAEKWIDGQVVQDSILGDNKDKTKAYWESRMRHDSAEKEKMNGYNKFRTSSSTSPVIQKMNAEIEELHRREKELAASQKVKLDYEEDEVFSSSNGSSVDEFETVENIRLESGFFSNAGEEERFHSESPDPETRAVLAEVTRTMTPLIIITDGGEEEAQVAQTQSNHLQEAPESPRVFTFQNKETPIEKEIRLARERDEEHRQRRQSSTGGYDGASAPPTPATPLSAKVFASPESTASANVKPSVIKEKERRGSGSREPARNLQYKMATERLKREMLEAKQREDELKARGKGKQPTPAEEKTVHTTQVTLVEAFEEPPKLEEKVESTSEPAPAEKTKSLPSPAQPELELHIEKQVPEAAKAPVRRTSFVSGDNELPQRKTSNILGRPSFNSIQRYLLKSSVQLRIGKNFQLPPTPAPEPLLPSAQVEEEPEEPVTPRRKLVPAQHKIEKELREMREREKELALIRTRSTPNLSSIGNELDDEEELERAEPKPRHNFEPKDRKRSTLINQWEEIIHAGN